jgi:16S rRNA (adenine1518-N6/adenine1519-N6)-dimethyltransferase
VVPDPCNITWLLSFLKDNNIRLRSSLSQNFLIDKNITKKIVKQISNRNQTICEIGSGAGAITNEIILRYPQNKIHLVEIDDLYAAHLRKTFPDTSIHHKDILSVNITDFSEQQPITIIGNIPFGIASKIIQHILPKNKLYNEVILVIQKEYGQRLCALSNTKDYSRLSIFTQLWCDVKPMFTISKTCFFPKPRVDSMVCKLTPHHQYRPSRISHIEQITKAAFHQRRKLLTTSLKSIISSDHLLEFLQQHNLPSSSRSEELSVEHYVLLSEFIESKCR